MTLKKYHEKRDFKVTAEPYGKKPTIGSHNQYLIQKHAASRLHYDFRLELEGVLKSWAVPKGPSFDPSVKRLAVHVEDHPIEYGSFEGIIPAGQYGGGTVMLWDQGTWEIQEEDANKAYKKGSFTFLIKGKKLKGLWKLIRIHSDPKNWLLIKVNDKYARAESEFDVTKEKPLSVVSRRTLDGIKNAQPKIWNSKETAKKKVKAKALIKASSPSIMPEDISPQLATLVDKPPSGEAWLHEVKFDGYRLICFIKNKIIRLMTRGKQDWTHKFPTIQKALQKLKLKDAILDGEVTVLDENLRTDFQLLQNHLQAKDTSSMAFYVFDLLYYDNQDLTRTPLLERKKVLESIIPQKMEQIIRYSDHVLGEGDEVFKKACQLNLEGIVSKSGKSLYHQKRTRDWLKVKCIKRQEFVIGGFTKPGGMRKHFGSLLLGYYSPNKELIYCGHVGTGFTEESLKIMGDLLKKNITTSMPYNVRPPDVKNVTWVFPVLVAEVEFTEWTRDGVLRHPSFKGLRQDKPAKKIGLEKPVPLEKAPAKKIKSTRKNPMKNTLTHPDKILYAEPGITKADLVEYYLSVQDWMLPYLAKRPLTLVRCPGGGEKKCFFQKHLDESTPSLFTVDIQDKSSVEPYAYLKDVDGLISLVQLSVLEIHAWGSHIVNVEKPDVIIFDLDPAPDIEWKKVIKAAFLIKEQLEAIKLKSFVKTTGGKGLHVVVPIKRKYNWEQIKLFAHAFAEAIVALQPKDYIATMSKEKRKGKIFIDYLRNQHGATAIAPYSTRANAKATVSVPLSWDELTVKIKSDTFTVKNLHKRLAALKKDPWAEFYELSQDFNMKNLESFFKAED